MTEEKLVRREEWSVRRRKEMKKTGREGELKKPDEEICNI